MATDWSDFEVADEPKGTDWSDFEPVQPSTITATLPVGPVGRAGAIRFTPQGFAAPGESEQSLIGISPELVPPGTTTATSALSAIGKTGLGIGQFITSPKGIGESFVATTPAAPVIMAKWAYDMARGGVKSLRAIKNELFQMGTEAFNRGVLNANNLGPVPQGVSTQEHIQSLAENAANAAAMGLGVAGIASHAIARGKVAPTPEEPVKEVPEAPQTIEQQTPPIESAPEQAPPSVAPAGESPTAPAVSAAETPVTAGVVPATAEPTTIRTSTQGGEETLHNTIKKAWEGYDENDTLQTPRDLAEAIEALPEDVVVPKYLSRALQRYKDAIEEDFTEFAGRGDVEPHEERFLEAVEKAASAKPKKPKVVASQAVPEPTLTGMGGALAKGEIPETGAGGEKYGVAERVRAERAQAGQVAPVEPGVGTTPEKTIELGREMVRKDPEIGPRIMAQFEADPEKRTSETGIAVARAHGEALAAGARTIEETYGTASPQYDQAKTYLNDWDKRSKAMQTQWHRQGQAQQGETDIDTGSFTGLNRARQQATGKDIPEPKKPQARKISKENKDAQEQVGKADAQLDRRIRTIAVEKRPTMSEAEKRAFDAANKTVREMNIRLAQLENKKRVIDQQTKVEVDKIEAERERKAQQAVDDRARRDATIEARNETKKRVAEQQRQKEIVEVQRKASQKALDAVNKTIRDMNTRAAVEERRRMADPSIPVWEKAKKYLDENKGLYNFDDLTNKIATDLKMDPERVKRIMARDQTTRRLANDLWIKQRNARRLKEQAKIWLRELDTPGYIKALASIPSGMFHAATFGHGLVALGTHAPIVAFQPRFWKAYVTNFGRMYKMVFNPAYYESQMADLVRRTQTEIINGKEVEVNTYNLARQSGLQNDPFQYEEFHSTMIRDMVKDWIGEKNMNRVDAVLSAGNRGYGVLKVLRQDMWDQKYNALPESIRKQEGVKEALSDDVNHVTGVTAKSAPKGVNIALFAPRLAGSRVMALPLIGGDAIRSYRTFLNWKNSSTAEKVFASNKMRETGWVIGTFASLLAANQGFLAAIGSKQKINGIPEALGGAGIDPLASDFLKFKVAGMDIAYGGALLTLAKLPVRMAYAIAYEGKGSKYVLEDERLGKVVFGYLRSQASPFAGTGIDLATGRDYEERPLPAKLFGTTEQTGDVPKRLRDIGVDEPYSWLEYSGTKLPIPMAEGLKEGLRMSGMSDADANHWMLLAALHSLLQTGTGTRITEDTREE